MNSEIKLRTEILHQIIAFSLMNPNTSFFIQKKFQIRDQKFGTFESEAESF